MRQHRTALTVATLAAFAALPSFAAITGTVMTKEGQPLAGAGVSIHGFETAAARRARLLSSSPEQVPIASTQTDSRGNFSLESPQNAVVSLQIFARGYEPLVRGVERDEEVGAVALPVSEMRSGSVTAGGKPVPGATIAITYNAFDYVTRSDDKGRYEAPDPKRARGIVVLHADYALDETSLTMRGGASGDLHRKLVAGSRLQGRVVGLDGQTPVANATITVDGWPLATSGEDGAFTIAHMPPKWTSLAARKEMLIGESSYSKGAAQTIRMQRAATISGRVAESKRSSPVAGVVVRAAQRRFGGFDTSVTAMTDAKGRYELVVPAGAYTLLANHPAYGPGDAEASIAPGQQASHDITVAPLARVSGTVVDETRRPIAVATVSVQDQGPRPGRRMIIRSAADAASGPDGRFSIRIPGDEEIRLKATKKGLPAVSSDPLRLAAGERKTNVVLTIPSGIAVTGRVTDRADNPLSGVTVTATKAETGPRGMMQRVMIGGMPRDEEDAVRTASDGTFTMRLEEGTYHFAFRREGYAQSVVNAQSVSAAANNVVDARLEPAVEIRGRITRGGAGVEGVRVMAILGGGEGTITASDGSFTLGGLSPGELRIRFTKQDEFIQETRAVTAPDADLVIELPAGGRITGRVVEKGSRSPITSFQAGVSGSRSGGGMVRMGMAQQRQFNSDDGSFTLENVPSGATTLVVSAPGYAEAHANVEVVASKTVADVEVELDPAVRLTGRVTGPTGAPLSDVSVSVVPTSGSVPLSPGRGTRATTNADGEYTIDGLEAGPQQIDFSHAKYLRTRKEVTLKGRETRLDAQLASGQRVSGIVVTESGAPVPDARVTALAAAGSMNSARTAADGTFEFDALTPARYRFTASKSGYADGVVEDQDVSGGAHIRITLSSGGTVYGRVIGLPERDLANVTVEARAGRSVATAAVDTSGSYRIEGAPIGTVQVSASLMSPSFTGRRSSGVQAVELSAGGARNVDLEFATDTTVTGRVTRNGVPLPGASVAFMPRVAGAQPNVSVTTDPAGRYAATGLADGEYEVGVVDTRSFSPYRTTYHVRGSGTFDIDFKASSVRGRVIDSSTNEPISDATVQLRAAAEELFRGGRGAVTDANGTFVVDNVATGAYVLTAAKGGFGNEIRELTVGESGVSGLELKLSRHDGVTLKVVDGRDGRALNASVSVFDMQGRLVHERGFFFGGSSHPADARLPLAPGNYIATVSAMGYAPRSVTFNSPSTQSVSLTPGGTLLIQSKHSTPRVVRLLDASGMPYPRQGVRPPIRTLLPSPGTTTLEHVAPGTYTIQLLGDNDMVVDSVTVVVYEGQTVTASI